MTVLEILKLIRDSLLTGAEIQRLITYLTAEVSDSEIEAMRKSDDEARKREEEALERAKKGTWKGGEWTEFDV
jgi:hypothetical protein